VKWGRSRKVASWRRGFAQPKTLARGLSYKEPYIRRREGAALGDARPTENMRLNYSKGNGFVRGGMSTVRKNEGRENITISLLPYHLLSTQSIVSCKIFPEGSDRAGKKSRILVRAH